MPRLHTRIDTFLAWLKWPVGVAAVLMLPALALAWWGLMLAIAARPLPLAWFGGGMVVYALVWRFVFPKRLLGSFFATFEHEMTHVLLAWLTFHRVTGLRVTRHEGGHMRYRGKGNWLITLGPYFLPTVSLLAMGALWLVPPAYRQPMMGLLGATVAYHAIATWKETHGGQTDLKAAGWVFSVCFLPSANLLMHGLIVAFAHGGREGAQGFVETLVSTCEQVFLGLVRALTG